MEPTFFVTPGDFRAWLEAHHETESELLVGFHKKSSGRPSVTWPESVDQALCFGWIDGVRRRIDDDSYSIRFTARKQRSNWSAVNVGRVGELTELGLMRPAGLAAFARRSDDRTAIYAYEQRKTAKLDAEQERRFKASAGAWKWFQAQPAGYRRTATRGGADDPLAHAAVGARSVRRRASVSAAPATAAAPAHSTAVS
jgi:uncharacterized protein YdeI (YjbR/CyaY-like superfamily)